MCTDWSTGNWSKCSKDCGGGTQTRTVNCPTGEICDENMKPSTSQTCNSYICPPDISNMFDDMFDDVKDISNVFDDVKKDMFDDVKPPVSTCLMM